MESYFQRCKMRILLGSPSVASSLGYPFASSHPWLHLPALFLLVKSTVGLGPACLRAMEVISLSLGYQPGTFLQCALTSATQLQMLTQESSWFLSSCLKHNLSSKNFFYPSKPIWPVTVCVCINYFSLTISVLDRCGLTQWKIGTYCVQAIAKRNAQIKRKPSMRL